MISKNILDDLEIRLGKNGISVLIEPDPESGGIRIFDSVDHEFSSLMYQQLVQGINEYLIFYGGDEIDRRRKDKIDAENIKYASKFLLNKTFKKSKHRSKPFSYSCEVCGKKMNDETHPLYWSRRDLPYLKFCSTVCAANYAEEENIGVTVDYRMYNAGGKLVLDVDDNGKKIDG